MGQRVEDTIFAGMRMKYIMGASFSPAPLRQPLRSQTLMGPGPRLAHA